MIDSHCHLFYKGLEERQDQIIQDAKKKMTAIINCGYPKDAKKSLELKKREEGFIYLSLGLHPIDIVEMTDQEIDDYIDFVRQKKDDIVAIGEIGLDKHWYPKPEQQPRLERVFKQMLGLAKDTKLPVILHTRKAEQECFDIVTENGFKEVVFHCYAGNMTLAKKIRKRGYYISIGTNLMRSKNTKKLAQRFPLEQLLTETDSPFLSPYPGKKNVPQNVAYVLEKMSKIRDMPVEDIDKVIEENCGRLFGIQKN